jgi:hypothetical protein
MRKSTENRARFAGFAAAAALVTASAFADARPPKVTAERGSDRQIVSRDTAHGAAEAWRSNSRSNSDRDTRAERVRDHGRRAPHHAQGRVTKVQKWNGGHRVWIAGTPQPFFVPASSWNRDRFRIGVTVRVGGYYNPAGWYDYDCWNCGGDVIRGVVVGVDYRRDFADVRLRNGEYVTVILPRRGGYVRPGDYVEVFGDWSRRGVFAAVDIDVLRGNRR